MKENNSRSKILEWMRDLQAENPDILFRGQGRVYSKVYPSMFRLSEERLFAMKKLCARMHNFATGIAGYRIENLIDELGLLQHYMELSPVLDLTGDPLVALYFALLGHNSDEQQVIYAFDKKDLIRDGLVVSDHNFLILPLTQNGHSCRWFRQDGYAVGLRNWHDITPEHPLDLLQHDHFAAFFRASEADSDAIADVPDLLAVNGDAIASRVYNFFHMLCDHLEISHLFSHELHKYGFKNPVIQMNHQLDVLMVKAKAMDDKWCEKEIERMRDANNNRYWDNAWDASFDFIEKKLNATLS